MDEGKRIRGSGRKKKKNSRMKIPVLLIVLAVIGIAGFRAVQIYMPNFQTEDFFSYHHLNPDEIQIVFGDEIVALDKYPMIENDEIYLPVDFVKSYIDPYIFWDERAQKLTITTENKVMRMNTDDLTYFVNMEPMTLNLPVYAVENSAYLPVSFLEELYDVSFTYQEAQNIALFDYTYTDIVIGRVTVNRANVRFEPNHKSLIAQKLVQDEVVTLYEETGAYTRVRTESGILGYIPTNQIEQTVVLVGYTKEEQERPPLNLEIDGRINLLWDQIETVAANHNPSKRIAHKGLDVISPTWFKFDRETYNGDIITRADMGYVNWAHSQGYQVWALFSDDEDGEVTAQILSDTEKREHVIRQLLAYVSMYNLDGINIDFERVRSEDVHYFHQFLRELAPMLREQGVILSVDVFVPSAWSMYYDRAEIGRIADFVCVMSYDENTWGGTSGPNASLPFVEQSVIDMLEEVPPEKLLLGLPFYSRVWIEEVVDGEVNYSIRSLGMNYAYRMFTENGAEFVWLEELGCYYGEFETVEDGRALTYKVWLEDERSIEEKLKLVETYDLAGVASWVRGLEKEEIWDLMYDNLKN